MRFWRKGIPRTAFMACLSLIAVLMVFLPGYRVIAEDEGVSNLSLYERASELTREFATAISPGSGVGDMHMIEASNSDSLLVAGNSGGLLGYAEILSDDTGIVGWLMNSYTAASATITYDQLMHVIDNGGDSVYNAGLNNPFFQYAGYGEVLTEMGLISSVRPGIGQGVAFIGSAIMLLVYLLANAAPFLFRGALMILTTLNPFRLFETAMNGTAGADLGIISGIADYVGSMYTTVQDFSIVFLLPMLLAVTVFSVLVFRKGSGMKKFARYGLRVFMLFAGLPLIGATYTGLIEDLDSQVSVGSEYADYLILSSYVDFENWVKYSRLAPPTDSDIRNPRYGEDEERTLSNRELILDINGTRANNTRAESLKSRYSATSDIGEIFDEGGARKDADSDSMSWDEQTSFTKVYSLLSRHMTGATYTGSDYDGEVSGQIQKIRAANQDGENDKMIVKMFTLSASDSRSFSQKYNPLDWSSEPWMEKINWNGKNNDVDSSAKGLFTEGNALNELFQFGSYRMNIYNSGDLRYTATNGYTSPNMPDVVTSKTAPIGTDRSGTVGGLSPLAMYNFLNTSFSNTGLTVYSPEKTSSDLSRDAYAAVTFGGSGISAFTRWVENVTVMFSLAVLSIAYGVMMVSVAIKSLPRILSGVFGTALGSIAFTTKLLISTAVLIIQVIGMIFLYALSENIIMTMLLNFNSLVDTGGSYFGTGLIFDFLGSFLVIVITAAITIFMVKNMKVFKELMEEVVTNTINRVMGALDTGTGGQGLDVSKTSGGRVGGDGKLTDAAREPKGIAGLLGQAHGIEAQREQMAQEQGLPKRDFGSKLGARLGTASDLIGASNKDLAKSLVGVDNGQSLNRELEAKERDIKSNLYKSPDEREKDAQTRGFVGTGEDMDDTNTTITGQTIDGNGEIVTDANGDALDANGNAISANTPLGMAGLKPMTGENGALLDADGNTYNDEMGNTFYQNEKGQLVDENGNYVALDKDGTLQPIDQIPGHNGKPVSAIKEAEKLDGMRFDADNYEAMTNEQDTTHYGLDKDGNAVGTNGEALQVNGADGPQPVRLDEQGFVTDADGNRVAAADINGPIDARGFEEVEDEDGETYLKHKGDEAMKNMAVPLVAPDKGKEGQNLTSLAKQSNRANALAKRADERVEALKAKGASPYAIMQAQRYADKMNKNAHTSQQAFNQAIQSDAKGQNGVAPHSSVTDDHVQSATRHANTERATLADDIGKLKQMKADGASPNLVARQERKVKAQQQLVKQAADLEQDLRTAKDAGRSYREVNGARSRVESAEQVYQKAQDAHAHAVASGQPKESVQKQEQKLNQASKVLSDAQANMARVSRKPSGSPEQIDKATAQYEQALGQHQQAQSKVQRLEQQSAATQTARREQHQAKKRYMEANNHVQQLEQNKAPRREIREAKRAQEKAKTKYEQANSRVQSMPQVSKQKVQKARKVQAQAKQRMDKAQSIKQRVLDPPGWHKDVQQAPQSQGLPTRSANESYAVLTTSGVSNYDDYSKQVKKHTTDLKNNQSKLKQAQQRLATLRTSNRPPQIIEQAESQVETLQSSVNTSQSHVKKLKDNAQGLLKKGNFQPVIASRPIRTNGTAIINQMVHMNHSQAIYDKLAHQEKAGTLTEAGRKQMDSLGGRLSHMRRDLIRSGIREDAIKDRAGIVASTKQMQQSWDSFVNGTSVENDE